MNRPAQRRAGQSGGVPSGAPSGAGPRDGSGAFLLQEALGVQGGHAARAGAGDGLAIDVVLHVAGGEHARDGGHGGHAGQAALGDDVAVFHFQLALENFGVGLVADGDEAALQLDVGGRAVLRALDAHTGDAAVVAQHFFQGVEHLQFHVAVFDLAHQLVHQDGLGAELVAAVDQVDLAGDVGQVQGLFHGGVAATDHDHVLVAVEEAVTGGAGGHTAAHEGFFGRQAQILGRGAGGQDDGVSRVHGAVAGQREGALGEVDRVDVVENDLRLEAFGVLLEALHQVGALHAIGVGRPVVHLGGGHQLAALLQAGDDDRLQVGAGGVDGGGPTGRAGTENQQLGVASGLAHGSEMGSSGSNARVGRLRPKPYEQP
ncbi:hypothetical protein Ddc_23368 [Ditylenchus destructor]|nr:hypothetical protein Ddc_23368 [Ditylenchus destructor]